MHAHLPWQIIKEESRDLNVISSDTNKAWTGSEVTRCLILTDDSCSKKEPQEADSEICFLNWW